MRLVIVSDTHGGHEMLGPIAGDVLIHCGDFALHGKTGPEQHEALDAWFARQDVRLVLVTGGNHDFELEDRTHGGRPAFRHAHYLEDSTVDFEGLRFYGAPWVPELRNWAYYLDGPRLADKWAAIPQDIDVLITHTPPRGILDTNTRGKSCGCPDLEARLATVRPRVHCFGHVHASAGQLTQGGTTYVNAAMVNHQYRIARAPIVIDL